ncbi:MAG TPA: hypothetical protein VEX60_16545 [Pyrinomonadaceae bacterium]|nr:hypothetical protein [Pyrinomonadaceae bacterium]
MSSKKKLARPTKGDKSTPARSRQLRKGNGGLTLSGNGKKPESVMIASDALPPRPLQRLPGESDEEREKRLEARKALTLRAFQMTYENRQRRKTS